MWKLNPFIINDLHNYLIKKLRFRWGTIKIHCLLDQLNKFCLQPQNYETILYEFWSFFRVKYKTLKKIDKNRIKIN